MTSRLAAAGLTTIPDVVPVVAKVTVSVAVIDFVPAVFSVDGEGVNAVVRGRERVVGRQDRQGVGAGEVDGAEVAGSVALLEFLAVTVTLKETPAVTAVGAETVR